ncbi:MAG: molybdate ABC transporter substrate-binding protein, partial [Candidatus Hodarchaeota archaeon]
MKLKRIGKKRNSISLSALTLIVIFSIVFGCRYYIQQHSGHGLIVAFCGSASKPALEECAEVFKEKTGIRVELHFSGSGKMLSELLVSKKGDLYIPGSPDYMTRAIQKNVIYTETVKRIAYLVPAIIVQKGNPKGITCLVDLAKAGITVGIGDPEAVCVGGYAKEILEVNGLYDEVEPNIVVYAESCSKTAALIPLGTVDAIMGWRVFHYWNPEKSDILFIEPKSDIPRISYIPAAVSIYTQNRNGAEQFIDFLVSSAGQGIFRTYGYLATEDEAREYAPTAVFPSLLRSLKKFRDA